MKGIIYSTSFLLDLKSKYDEEISLREGAEQKVTNLRQELQKERSTVEDLKTELVFTSHHINVFVIFRSREEFT